jgi:5-methylcytosine-specific restriction endonuclease McrA
MNESKVCKKCLQLKPLELYNKDKTRKDGYFPYCKSCTSLQAKTRYADNPEPAKQRASNWRINNPEKKKQNNQNWIESNREKHLEYQREWARNYRKDNPNYSRRNDPEYLQSWRKQNPDKARNQKLRRRAREANARSFLVTPKDISKILSNPCIYCKEYSYQTHIDHIIPISRGGEHRIGNLAAACAKCNTSKHSKFVSEWKLSKKKSGTVWKL